MDDDAINALIKIASKEVSYVQLVKPFSVFETRQISFFSFFSVLIGMVFSVTRIIPMGVIVFFNYAKNWNLQEREGDFDFCQKFLVTQVHLWNDFIFNWIFLFHYFYSYYYYYYFYSILLISLWLGYSGNNVFIKSL